MLTGFDLCRAAIAAPGVTGPERSVLMVLAIMADNETAQCYPPVSGPTGITAKAVLSERAVQRAIARLVELGHISRRQRKHGVIYTVHPDLSEPTPATQLPVSGTPDCATGASEAPTPATVAPKPPVTTTLPKDADASSGARLRSARRSALRPGWSPKPLTGKSADIVERWAPGMLERVLDAFSDHHTARGTVMADWDAAWRTWIGREDQYRSRDRNNGKRHHASPGDGPSNPMVRAAADDLARRYARGELDLGG